MSQELRNRKPKATESPKLMEKKFKEDDEKVHFSLLDILRMLAGFLLLNFMISYYFTGTLTYKYKGKLIDPHYLHFQLFGRYVNLTESELSLYDGSNKELPLYIAVNGTVFDVSSKRRIYGPGGSYSFFGGKDCARALATNCLNHLNHDIRDIRTDEERRLKGWIEYFDDKYFRVGVVQHPPMKGLPLSRDDCKGKQGRM